MWGVRVRDALTASNFDRRIENQNVCRRSGDNFITSNKPELRCSTPTHSSQQNAVWSDYRQNTSTALGMSTVNWPCGRRKCRTDQWREHRKVRVNTLTKRCHRRCLHNITGCAVAQHCYNGDVSFLWEKWKIWTPVKSKPLNRLTHNLSGLITSTRGTYVPNLVKIGLRGTSGQRGEI